MKSFFNIISICFLINPFFGQTTEQASKQIILFFETNSYDLAESEVLKLNQLIESIDPKSNNWISIEGSADDRGTEDLNNLLSQNRCTTVSNYIKNNYSSQIEIKVTSLGEKAEPKKNQEVIRAQNRSVVVNLYNRNIFDYLKPREQTFAIDPSSKEVITTAAGVRIEIPPYAFQQDKGGRIFGKVNVTIKEYTNTSQFILAGLNTISNGEMLQSGGMFDIKATYNGDRNAAINPKNPIKAIIPTDTALPDMQVFYQSHDSILDIQTWDISGTPALRGIQAQRSVISFKSAFDRLGDEDFNTKD